VKRNPTNMFHCATIVTLSAFLAGAVSHAATFRQADGPNGIVSVEAENFASKTTKQGHSWEVSAAVEGFSGKGYAQAVPDNEANQGPGEGPELNFQVSLGKAKPTFTVYEKGFCRLQGARYCKVNQGEEWQADSRTGSYADIAVDFDIPGCRFVFSRGSSYLPYWTTDTGRWFVEEILPRSGDGTDTMPDKVNKYSQVFVIENSPARAVVRWRYAPDFEAAPNKAFAEEYFTIYPDGLCIRAVRKPAEDLERWMDPANIVISRFRLAPGGIEKLPAAADELKLLLAESCKSDFEVLPFDTAGGSYVLKCRKNALPSKLELTLTPQKATGVKNPAVLVRNWGDFEPRLKLNGHPFSDYHYGYVHFPYSSDLVLWLNSEIEGNLDISISPGAGSPAANQPPVVDAGPDISLVVDDPPAPVSLVLSGSATDDGLPADNLKVSWSKLTGPGKVVIRNEDKPSTEVLINEHPFEPEMSANDVAYKFRMTAKDGGLESSDEVLVNVRKRPAPVAAPSAYWSFDEQSGRRAIEAVGAVNCRVDGHKPLYKAGVLGTAMQFDGYSTVVTCEKTKAPSVGASLTTEAWVAVGAYPWNWAPIVHQSHWNSTGYYFGIDQAGRLGLKVAVDGKWVELTSERALELYRWTYVAAEFDGEDGRMSLYMDGKKVARLSVPRSAITPSDSDLLIGRNNVALQPTDAVRPKATLATRYGFDGLIDELKIYSRALGEKDIAASYQNTRPDRLIRDNPDMQKRVLPGMPGKARFGAYYTRLRYYETWDNLWRVAEHPDVVVKFDDSPVSVVFWRGTSYGPGWVTENNKWLSDQSVEEGGGGTLGCCEHMSDKQCRHAHARIIESTDARVIVHWRYALVDILYRNPRMNKKTGWGDWVDEYLTIYPDAVGIRNVKYYSSKYGHYSLQDTQFLSQPGTRPEDNIELESLTVVTQDGQSKTLSWAAKVPENDLEKANIELVNLKSKYRPFLIFRPGVRIEPWGQSEKNDYCPWPTWNHWPAAQILSDGRLATAPDRLTHSALGAVDIDDLKENMMMYGLTDKPATSLVPLAKSWNCPPKLNIASDGFSFNGYDRGHRAYLLSQDSPVALPLQFTLDGSKDSPVFNPCFVIKNWRSDSKVSLALNGKTIQPGPNFRQGIETSGDEHGESLVVWLKTASNNTVNIRISQ